MDLEWTSHPLLLVVNMLAAFRLTRFIVADAVPLGPLRAKVRDALNLRAPWSQKPWPQLTEPERRRHQVYDGEHPLAYLLTCYWCAGLYVSVTVALLASTGPWWTWVAAPLALSAAVGLLAALD